MKIHKAIQLRIFAPVLLMAFFALMIAAFRPNRLAIRRCPDGSVLTVESVTFGTNHVWLRRSWFRSVPFSQWTSERPSMAVWGVWEGKGQQTHAFKFVQMHEQVEKEKFTLTPHMQGFRPGKRAGLLATTTNAPSMFLRVRVYEQENGETSVPSAEFRVKNVSVIKDKFRRKSRLSVRLNPPPYWSVGTDFVVANALTDHEILVEKYYNFGPIQVKRTFD